MNNINRVCLIKHGTKRGDEASNLNILMPAQTELSNLEIAEILTYIGNSWGNQIGFISVNNVTKYLVDCTTHRFSPSERLEFIKSFTWYIFIFWAKRYLFSLNHFLENHY